jgi:hypothetical protein
MTKISHSTHGAGADSRGYERRHFAPEVLLKRLERWDSRRGAERSGAFASAPARPDAELLEQGEALESAWAREIAALIAVRKRGTPKAVAAACFARAATAQVAARIDTADATTLDGLKVKARAILWRRNGEPLAAIARGEPLAAAAPQRVH